eukprot:1910464-Amphidinium_carterae.1
MLEDNRYASRIGALVDACAGIIESWCRDTPSMRDLPLGHLTLAVRGLPELRRSKHETVSVHKHRRGIPGSLMHVNHLGTSDPCDWSVCFAYMALGSREFKLFWAGGGRHETIPTMRFSLC